MPAESMRAIRLRNRVIFVSFVALLLFLASPTMAQVQALFDSTIFARNLRSRFHLTTKDMSLLRPMIERQNEDLLIMLANRLEADNSSYMSLWDDMRRKSLEFEESNQRELTSRQRLALLAARSEAEAKIADEWIQNYVQLLGDVLELDWVQANRLISTLEIEQEQRLRLLNFRNSNSPRVDASWQSAGTEREGRILSLLSPSQINVYRKLSEPFQHLIARNEHLPNDRVFSIDYAFAVEPN